VLLFGVINNDDDDDDNNDDDDSSIGRGSLPTPLNPTQALSPLLQSPDFDLQSLGLRVSAVGPLNLAPNWLLYRGLQSLLRPLDGSVITRWRCCFVAT